MEGSRDFNFFRNEMVEKQLVSRGIDHVKILEAFRKIPRHLFVPKSNEQEAYEDHPLPIGFDQTISQPYIIALMVQCLMTQETSRILELGTGSGYQTAILAELSKEIYTVERISELSKQAEERLRFLGYQNISFKWGDGSEGWDAFSPYDGILVSCASREIPLPLLTQLKEERRLVIPLGGPVSQVLTVLVKHRDTMDYKEICGCAFVPLVEGKAK